jgi:hypothetical protein
VTGMVCGDSWQCGCVWWWWWWWQVAGLLLLAGERCSPWEEPPG